MIEQPLRPTDEGEGKSLDSEGLVRIILVLYSSFSLFKFLKDFN